ncbi:ATP-binding protein [Streptomyces sp. 8K308]|uniref:ATP-binding protein n=1 Tax=Streptomyces sp. 8K308 TaxID=2530388 RepID=UPI00104D93EE|nr:ATP-binding protein [Streptomyces sp. 8K308]TDC20603.1 ATP-binding protein [Streptomyces sp. 8K308]
MHRHQEERFNHHPASVRKARDFAATTLELWGINDRADDIRLCVSELATNALRAAPLGRGFLMRLALDDERLRVEVHDSGDGQPRVRNPTDTGDGGRGLYLISQLSDDWGVATRNGPGKLVWTEFKIGT